MVRPQILFRKLADERLVRLEEGLRKRFAVRIFIRCFRQLDEVEFEFAVCISDGCADDDGQVEPLRKQGRKRAGRRGKAEEIQKDAAVRRTEVLVRQETDGIALPQGADDFPPRAFARDDDEAVVLTAPPRRRPF